MDLSDVNGFTEPQAEAESDAGAYEALIQFLYQAPIGLLQTTLDGDITLANPMAAQLLLPLAPDCALLNLFDVLLQVAPQLRTLAAAAPYPGGDVCDGLRLHTGPAKATGSMAKAPTTLSLRVQRLGADQLMCSVNDISAAVQLEQQRLDAGVRDASRIDNLTALPNRSAVLEHIEHALQRARIDPAFGFAVLFINADRFNRVNVTRGPTAGDELLRRMAARISGAVRPRDAVGHNTDPVCTAARLGMDEFVVVLEAVQRAQVATAVAQRLVDTLAKPYRMGEAAVHSTASVGVVLCGDSAANADAVLQDASLAMREAKRAGGSRHCLFEGGMRERARRSAHLEAELRLALQEGQLFVVYQPITHLSTHPGTQAANQPSGVAGVEALVRWQHPVRGLVPPMEFIEMAESSGLITPLGRFVLRSACQQFAQWQGQLGAKAPQMLSVNLSRAQLGESDLVETVRAALQDTAMAAAQLQLEITESLAAADPAIQARLHELKALGVMLALDDFGTGYSSLSSLHQWPVDVIKIDRSFVSQVTSSAHHRVLVEATVRVARSLGMGTVAEGVETTEQAQALRALHCDKAQGYLYAKPLRAEEATRWLGAYTAPSSVQTETLAQPSAAVAAN